MGATSKRVRDAFSESDFKALVETGKRAFLSDNPNPERRSCPEPRLLRDLAFRRIEKERALELTLHLRTCSDCFRDVSTHVERFNEQHRSRVRIAVAATLLLVVGVGAFAWKRLYWSQQSPQTVQRGSQPAAGSAEKPVPAPAEVAEATPPLPVVDYRVLSPTRGTQPVNAETLTLRGERLRLRIHLPLGSEAGEYEIRLHQKADKKEVLKSFLSASKANNFIVVIEEDFGKFPPGDYLLAIFSPGWKEEVQAYPVRILSSRDN